jgi:hypothetical protein
VKRQATPGGAQNGQPGHPVAGVQQGPGQGQQILDHRAGVQLLQLHGLEGLVGLAECGQDLAQVLTAADQHHHAGLGVGAPLLLDDLDHLGRLDPGVLLVQGVDQDSGTRQGGARGRGRGVADRAGVAVFGVGEDPAEALVEPVHQGGLRAEVAGQREGAQGQGAQPLVPGPQEEPDLGVPEAVDRLHGVAHQEQRPAIPRLPAGCQAAQQSVLGGGGILILVHQQVADPMVQRQGQVGRSVLGAQGLDGLQRELGEVAASGFAEDQRQLRGGQHQDFEEGLQDLPLPVLVGRGGESPDAGQAA